jgi:predicted oxidoreductase
MRISGVWNRADFLPEHEERGRAALLAAYDAGYTLFDHADIYGNRMCEEIHGRLLKESPDLRRRTIIATKCGIRWSGDPTPDAPHRYDFSRDYIVRSCEGSLTRLGVDAIDVYQLHRPDELMDPDEVCEAFLELQAAGKVRFFGVSNFRPDQVEMLQSSLPFPLAVNQVEVHLGRLACLEDGTLSQCIAEGISPLAWSPLGGGWLGDGGAPRENDPAAEQKRALLAEMDAVAEKHGCSRTIIALAWLMRHPSEIIPIVGSSNQERIRDAAKAAEVELSREDWYRLLIAARGRPLP